MKRNMFPHDQKVSAAVLESKASLNKVVKETVQELREELRALAQQQERMFCFERRALLCFGSAIVVGVFWTCRS